MSNQRTFSSKTFATFITNFGFDVFGLSMRRNVIQKLFVLIKTFPTSSTLVQFVVLMTTHMGLQVTHLRKLFRAIVKFATGVEMEEMEKCD